MGKRNRDATRKYGKGTGNPHSDWGPPRPNHPLARIRLPLILGGEIIGGEPRLLSDDPERYGVTVSVTPKKRDEAISTGD